MFKLKASWSNCLSIHAQRIPSFRSRYTDRLGLPYCRYREKFAGNGTGHDQTQINTVPSNIELAGLAVCTGGSINDRIFEHPIIANGRYKALLDQLTHFLTEVDKTKWPADNPGRHHQITVNYGGVAGQDLEWLAQQTGLSVAEVIDLHCSAIYTVQFLGFLPGFAYLTGLPKQLHFSRRETPRSRVPAGTLAIAAHYCAVYPWESPGGWHLMGHVEQLLFDPERNPQEGPSIFNAGDTVQFVRADHA